MTREERIKNARAILDGDCSDELREALVNAFPELAESEDERIRKALIEFLREAYSRGIAPEECAKWIVWLDKQKEQQPAGGSSEKPNSQWGEEDETCLEYALWCVTKTRHFVAKDACDLDACRCAERWLKALKNRGNSPKTPSNSTWKPSEEQMKALKNCVNGWTDNADGRLESLYNDLKKL